MSRIGGVVGVVGSAGGSGRGGNGGAGHINDRNGGYTTRDPWEAARIMTKWYEKNAEKIKQSQQSYDLKKKLEEQSKEENENKGTRELTIAQAATVKFDEDEWKEIREKEAVAAENMRKMIRMNPDAARFFYEILKDIEREYGIRTLPAMVYEVATIRGAAFDSTCRAVNRFHSKAFQSPCYRACEKYKLAWENGKPVLKTKVPITIYRHIDKATGRVINTEFRWGHRYEKPPWDPEVYTEVEWDYREVTISGREAEAAARIGFYCPLLLDTATNKTPLLVPEKEVWMPEKAVDHFPQDIIAEVDENGEIRRLWLSRKHGSEESDSE